MAAPHLRRKSYKIDKEESAQAIANKPLSYHFDIDGKTIDLEPYKQIEDKNTDLAWAFAIVLWRKRNEITASTAETHIVAIDRFFEYCQDEIGILPLNDIDQSVISGYSYWMRYLAVKRDGSKRPLSEESKRSLWGHLRSYFEEMIHYGLLNDDIKLPVNVFSSNESNPYKPFTHHEQEQIANACERDIALVNSGSKLVTEKSRYTPYLAPLIPHSLLISLRTGLNPEVLFEMDVTEHSLKSSHLLNSTRLVLPIKKRSGRSMNIELLNDRKNEVRLNNGIITLLKEVESLTQNTRDQLAEGDPLRRKLWLVKADDGRINVFRRFVYYLSLQSFCKRHRIVDEQGELISLNYRRFRPTFAEEMLKINGGDIRDLQKRLGHSFIRTTMGYLDPNLDERKEAFQYAGKTMEHWAMKGDTGVDVQKVSKQLDIPIVAAEKLSNGDFDMGAAKCKNPFDSPLEGVKKGELCTNYLACFRCGNCVVLKEDSHRLFSFYYWLIDKKHILGNERWESTYGWIIEIIDNDIAPQLGNEKWVNSEKTKARDNPFPMWDVTSSVDNEGLI